MNRYRNPFDLKKKRPKITLMSIIICVFIAVTLIILATTVMQFFSSGGFMGNPDHVNVTRSEAASIARDHMGGGFAGLTQLSRRGGEYVWIVEVTTMGMRSRYYDVYVCAMTGDVIREQQTFRDRGGD